MNPAALEAISRMGTIAEFYDQPVDSTSNHKTAAVFHTSSGVYLAVGPVSPYWHEHKTVGVEKRMDGRWCWVIETP